MFTLHDRRILVTGGGSGIGAATARLMAGRGGRVALVGRTASKLEAVRDEIEKEGGTALVLPADLFDPQAPAQVVEEAARELGGLDVVVNNAALYRAESVARMSLQDWQMHFDLNLRAPFLLCQAAHPWLKSSGRGVVVNVLSTLAQRPVPGVAAYSASKAALWSLTQTLALEWAGDGIRSVAVSPGVVDTPIHEGRDLTEMAAMHPLGRVGTAQEIAAAILYLACDASAWTTGSVLTVDGGIHLA